MQVFEDQIQSQKTTTKTPTSAVTRRIVSEEISSGSPSGSSLARSPAMHDGFKVGKMKFYHTPARKLNCNIIRKAEDWKVERTPVNTPAATIEGSENRIIVGMINLSDEEEEDEDEVDKTSVQMDSETAFRSISNQSSSHSTQEVSVEMHRVPSMDEIAPPEDLIGTTAADHIEDPCPPEPREPALVEPPAGFGDSPVKQPVNLMDVTSPPQEYPARDEMLVAEKVMPEVQEERSRPAPPSSVASEEITAPTPTASIKSSKSGRKSKNRSRSSSKERLLMNLAEADTAPRTPMEEDELSGTHFFFLF